MFKHVKKRLTLLYTLSLLFFLILFISLLYFFITKQMEWNQKQELLSFYRKESHEFIEHYYEDDEREVEFDPHKKIFFYVFDESNQLLFGNETVEGLSDFIAGLSAKKSAMTAETIKTEWNGSHLLIMEEPLQLNGNHYATVYVGMDITDEKHFIQNITWIFIGLTICFSLVFGSLGYYFAGQAMKPITMAFEAQRKFVSDASHELRTPLSVFISSIDVLMREEKENLSPFGQEVLQDMKTETTMMKKLIDDLLFLARSDNHQLKIIKEKIDLANLLESQCEKIARTAPETIEFRVSLDKDVYILGDDVRIQQLVYILLENAFRYTPKGHVSLSLKKQGDKAILTVADSGVGIKPEDLPHIFDRFYRGDISRVRDGSGLGLSIAKSIVAAHDGKIDVKSKPGAGSTFTITFKLI
jgi:signal transduction histidine kinase